MLLFTVLVIFLSINFIVDLSEAVSTCNPVCTADSVPANPGISSTLLNQASTYGVYTPTNYSEVVTMFTMGPLPLGQWPRDNCPHLQSGLIPFTSLFTRYTPGMNVTVPYGQSVIFQNNTLNVATPTFNMIQVYGNLIFDDQNLNMMVGEIRVWPNASLQIGSPSCRLFANIAITFTGSAASSSQVFWDSSNKTSKGIMSKGSIDIHGKQYHPTWTRLSRKVASGKTVIFLQDVVNWEVGQLVLITTSAWFDCPATLQRTYCQNRPHQNEIRMITGIQQTTSGEQALLLNASLTYSHYSGNDYQVEVALLSRRINLAGQLTNDNFGGHTLSAGSGSARFSGVRGDRMGQLNVLGRYPFHFHMLVDGSTSFVQDCVVTNSYFRAYTIHDTNYTTLSRNIAYGVLGHAYYLESGTEENNVIQYNFAAQVTPIGTPAQGTWCGCTNTYTANATFLNPSDVSASGFYILNAYNTFIGNVAIGGASGFIFPNAPYPVFLPTNISNGNNNPQNRPTLLFQGNVAHSTGFYWPEQGPAFYVGAQLVLNSAGVLTYNPGRYSRTTMFSNSTKTFMLFQDTKVMMSNKGILHWGAASQVQNFEIFDMGFAGVFLFGQSGLNNALIAGYSSNTYNGNYMPALATSQSRGGIQFYDTVAQLIISNVTFRNFNTHGASDIVIGFIDGSDQYLSQAISGAQGIQYQNIGTGVLKIKVQNCGGSSTTYGGCGYGSGSDGNSPSTSSLVQNVLDYDGTMSGTPGSPKLVGGFGNLWKQGTDCVYDSNQHTNTCNWYSNRGVVFMSTGTGALIKGCQSGICAGCPNYNGQCCYTIGYSSLWGSLASGTKELASSWGGTAGPANTGWYTRMYVQANPGYTLTSTGFVTGAPKQWYISSIQVPRGNFVVNAIAYPATAVIDVWLQRNGVNYLPYPQATSYAQIVASTEPIVPVDQMNCTLVNSTDVDDYCQYTGATGPLWYFDGSYLYIRVVNPTYYLYNSYQQNNLQFEFEGASLWTQDYQWGIHAVVNNCTGCTVTYSFTGWAFYAVPDVPPPQDFPVYTGNTQTVPVWYATSKTVPTGSPSVTCSSAPNLANYPHAAAGSCTSSIAPAALGTSCVLSCASGYQPVGDMTIYCQSTGTWSLFDSESGCA